MSDKITKHHATTMDTPYGQLPIRECIRNDFETKTDREIADIALGGRFVNPEYLAELIARGLCERGMFAKDIYARIRQREEQERI